MAFRSKSGIGTSAVALSATSISFQYAAEIKAAASNTGKVYIGLHGGVTAGTDESNDGFELSAGDSCAIQAAEASNLNQIYAIATATGQKVFMHYV